MRKQNPRATTFGELAGLACSSGLVQNSEAGKQAFMAWLAKDQKAARKALFTQVAASRARAQASTKKYPAGWLRAAGVRPATATPAAPQAAKQYPANWLRGSGIPGPAPATGARITEARD